MASDDDGQRLLDLVPFARTIGMTLLAADRAEVVAALDWSPRSHPRAVPAPVPRCAAGCGGHLR